MNDDLLKAYALHVGRLHAYINMLYSDREAIGNATLRERVVNAAREVDEFNAARRAEIVGDGK